MTKKEPNQPTRIPSKPVPSRRDDKGSTPVFDSDDGARKKPWNVEPIQQTTAPPIRPKR